MGAKANSLLFTFPQKRRIYCIFGPFLTVFRGQSKNELFPLCSRPEITGVKPSFSRKIRGFMAVIFLILESVRNSGTLLVRWGAAIVVTVECRFVAFHKWSFQLLCLFSRRTVLLKECDVEIDP